MKQLIIIGARAMGRETCAYAREAGMNVKGFIDDKEDALDGFSGYPPILGSVEDYVPTTEDVFVSSLGDPVNKLHYAKKIEEKGGVFISVIHPSTYIGHNVQIGKGCIICPNVTITNDTVIGVHVIVNLNSSINHDNRIGSGSTICPGCHLAGRVQVGRNVFLGIGTTIIPDVTLGDNVFVAAGSVVTKSFDSGRLMGAPAIRK